MAEDLLNLCGIPEHIRWYAHKCMKSGISYASYAGYHIFTRPVAIDGNDFGEGAKVFSVSELYIRSLNNLSEISSEERIYVNCSVKEIHEHVRINAPYVSLRQLSSAEFQNICAKHYILYFGAVDIEPPVPIEYKISYIFDLSLQMTISGANVYGCPKFHKQEGEFYETEEDGVGQYHLLALGLIVPDKLNEICKCPTNKFSNSNSLKKCLKRPPNPKIWTYRDDLPNFSYSDMLFLLKNKTAEDICKTIRRPLMHYFPDVDYSANEALCEAVESTRKAVEELKAKGYPNCP